TNMAGRGTDILLGGNADFIARDLLRKGNIDALTATPQQWNAAIAEVKPHIDKEHEEVVRVGGLHIIGTERHEARRIDNQLRGRAGRQGDPGSSKFYLSLEDDLMRIFGSDRIKGWMQTLGMEDGVPIEHSWVTKSIARAQKQVEAQNFSVRKHLLEYDDVMNKQRENVYGLRRQLLEGQIRFEDDPEPVGIRDYLMTIAEGVLDNVLESRCDETVGPEDWDIGQLKEDVGQIFGLEPPELAALDEGGLTRVEIREKLWG